MSFGRICIVCNCANCVCGKYNRDLTFGGKYNRGLTFCGEYFCEDTYQSFKLEKSRVMEFTINKDGSVKIIKESEVLVNGQKRDNHIASDIVEYIENLKDNTKQYSLDIAYLLGNRVPKQDREGQKFAEQLQQKVEEINEICERAKKYFNAKAEKEDGREPE